MGDKMNNKPRPKGGAKFKTPALLRYSTPPVNLREWGAGADFSRNTGRRIRDAKTE